MNILNMLEDDHERVKLLLQKLKGTTQKQPKERKTLLENLKSELLLHEDIEEDIFYPPLRKDTRTKDMVLEAFEEHRLVDELIEDLEGTPEQDDRWAAKLKVLTENIQHHIDEEEQELFPKAKEVLSLEKLKKMGEQAQEHKEIELT